MYKIHPLYKSVQDSVIELDRLWDFLKNNLNGVDKETFFNRTLVKQHVQMIIQSFMRGFSSLVYQSISQSVVKTIEELERTYDIDIGIYEQLELVDKIEKELLKPFAGKTIQTRLNRIERLIRNLINQNSQLWLSGLKPNNIYSAYGWSYRLLVTEMLRAYHITVKVFTVFTGGKSIEVKLYKPHHKEDEIMSEFEGIYSPKHLPDYPRPMAEYLLKINY